MSTCLFSAHLENPQMYAFLFSDLWIFRSPDAEKMAPLALCLHPPAKMEVRGQNQGGLRGRSQHLIGGFH